MTPSFLKEDSLVAAPALLGWTLVSDTGDAITAGLIVEVEAYRGSLDPASHAYRGRTTRNAPMFEAAGTIYVYRSYGVHACVNIVTGPVGEGQAVLIRALEPQVGLDFMAARRGTSKPTSLTSGPGRLTQALGITLAHSGTKLGDPLALVLPDAPLQPNQIASSPRVGISRAIDHPWRFYIRDNPFVSRRHLWQDSP